MTHPIKLEIAANSVASALAAQDGGADRIELCAALEVGGLTPSYATIALARERLHIPVYALIRPRAGDFVYSLDELETMRRDIEQCAVLGCDGVVIGALDENGHVDVVACRALVEAAGRLGVTFHRAIDVCADPAAALEQIVALGCERVLTSGAAMSAAAGAARIAALVQQADGRVAVMAGGGVGAANVAALRARTGAHEFHASAKHPLPTRRRDRVDATLGMHEGEWRTDAAEVHALVAALRAAWKPSDP